MIKKNDFKVCFFKLVNLYRYSVVFIGEEDRRCDREHQATGRGGAIGGRKGAPV
jgi:hypothetical protein